MKNEDSYRMAASEAQAEDMNILVLCTGNSARSILLEALLNELGNGRITAFSAGSQPAGMVHPRSITVLEQMKHPTQGLRSKSWDEFASSDAPHMHAVITVCDSAASESCPLWPGAPLRAHWGITDPTAVPPQKAPAAFRNTYAVLRRRAEAFVAKRLETMDFPALSEHLQSCARIN